MDRSLYIFCCNSRKCSLKSEAWIVYRNQAIETITPTTKTNETKAIPVPSQTPLNTIWSGLGSNQTNSAADVTFDDLESLLMARDEVTSKSQTTIKKKNPTIPTATISTTTTSLDHSDHSNLMGIKWPAWSISEELEQVLFEDAEEGADVDDEHTREAYQRYLAEEEDRELVNMLTHGVTAGNISSQENMHFEDDESEEAPSLVENSAAEAVELEFQKRCALQPRQVMRYAYGESPHWCTLPVPAEVASLPRCEQCGSMRVFEMQLMPALLSLPLPTPPASNVSSSSTSETLEDRLGDALDFGTVAIYTCPNSCSTDGEGKLVREFVIVQPPSDIRG